MFVVNFSLTQTTKSGTLKSYPYFQNAMLIFRNEYGRAITVGIYISLSIAPHRGRSNLCRHIHFPVCSNPSWEKQSVFLALLFNSINQVQPSDQLMHCSEMNIDFLICLLCLAYLIWQHKLTGFGVNRFASLAVDQSVKPAVLSLGGKKKWNLGSKFVTGGMLRRINNFLIIP